MTRLACTLCLLLLPGVVPIAAAAPAARFTQPCLDQLPSTTVQRHDGQRVDFRRELLDGQLVAINFVFTRCQGICPVLGAQFAELQTQLHERRTGARLLSISLDPAYDSAERLAQWSARLGRGTGWTLLTGEVERVQGLLRAFGMAGGDPWSHAPVTWLVDARRAGAAPQCERLAGMTTAHELAELLSARWSHASP